MFGLRLRARGPVGRPSHARLLARGQLERERELESSRWTVVADTRGEGPSKAGFRPGVGVCAPQTPTHPPNPAPFQLPTSFILAEVPPHLRPLKL